MTDKSRYVRFDWAIKRILRDKANKEVLEGLAEGFAEGFAEGREEGLAKGREEGLAEGRAEGESIGIEKARRENALKMKADNMPLELIAKYTGLTEDEIATL